MPSEVKKGMRYTYKDNVTICKPLNFKPVPAFCPVCKCFMSGVGDIEAYDEYKCCQSCALTWAEPNLSKWCDDNWRPSGKQIREEKKKRITQLRNLSINR